LVTEKGALLL